MAGIEPYQGCLFPTGCFMLPGNVCCSRHVWMTGGWLSKQRLPLTVLTYELLVRAGMALGSDISVGESRVWYYYESPLLNAAAPAPCCLVSTTSLEPSLPATPHSLHIISPLCHLHRYLYQPQPRPCDAWQHFGGRLLCRLHVSCHTYSLLKC